MRTAALILAAGSSSRFGQPKQCLIFEGKTLLKRTIDAAENSDCEKTLVVTGAYSEKTRAEIGTKTMEVFHQHWKKGMGAGLAFGLKEILKTENNLDAVLILLCDQPFADTTLINTLIKQKNSSKKGIVASAYAGTRGAPVLFTQKYFPELLRLTDDTGAKKLLQKHTADVAVVDFPLGKLDMDTMADYARLKKL